MNNLFNAYGSKLKFDNKELFAYWNPEDLNEVDEEELRTLKVGYRAKMIKRVSEAFARNEIDELELRKMKTEDAKQELLKLYGVGPATAQIILGGYLRKTDTFSLKGRLILFPLFQYRQVAWYYMGLLLALMSPKTPGSRLA